MKLTWLGHACFLLEQDHDRIVLDPYEGVEGYPALRVESHEILCSHQHFDHNAVGCVTKLSGGKIPFTIRTVNTFHDDCCGAARGENTIHIITAGGVTVAHLGDLGHALTAEHLAQIGPVDGVLVPVGGVYTLDAAGAKQVCQALRPRWIVPMHYHHAPYGLPNVAGVEPFLALWPADQIHRLSGREILPTPETEGILVPVF